MPETMSKDKTRIAVLTIEPADPEFPTKEELNAGLRADNRVLRSDFQFSAADPTTFTEPAVSSPLEVEIPDQRKYVSKLTLWRYFDTETGNADLDDDELFQAMKVDGTTLWQYARRNGKLADEPWDDDDEIYLGAKIVTGSPQQPTDLAGYVKVTIPTFVREAWEYTSVGGGS